jgi:cell division transport system permease protein
MTFEFFIKEALRAMRRNSAPSFAAFATIVVTLIVVGVFIPIVQATQGAASNVGNKVLVDVYLKAYPSPAPSPAQVAKVARQLKALPNVKSVRYESATQALHAAMKNPAERAAYQMLSYNPLPDTFHITPTVPGDVFKVRTEVEPRKGKFINSEIASLAGQTTETKKILEVTKLVEIIAAVLSVLLVIASIVLIANTIRLSLYARRREIEVMKLVGATDWFIRWPFVIEGIVVGAAGAITAILLLAATKIALLDPLASNWTLLEEPRTIPFFSLVALLIGAGVAVSAAGSGLSLRRFLRV